MPIVLVVGIASYSINSDINGDYKGISPITGSVRLSLNEEDNRRLTGELVLKDRIHLPIASGKLLDDDKLKLIFRLPRTTRRNQRFIESNAITFVGNHKQNTIEGFFNNGSNDIPLKLKRATTSAFFSRRWFSRFTGYFAGNSK